MPQVRSFLLPAAAWLAAHTAAATAADLAFNRDIRPVLADKCFACHGFDAKKRKAGLRLDAAEGALAKNKEGQAAIVPGNPAASLLWQRITATDPDDVMPPPESHKSLSDAEKALLKQWIEQGAPYQKHWAFEPIVAAGAAPGAALPDAPLEGELQRRGMAFCAEADKPTLIRRVSFALTGLPPSLAQIDAFLADTSDAAYVRMVDRFLASPHYGEEMARHWLDVARYADTHGMHLDNERQMWAYRDWVIRAFNDNKPFDQFTIEQLAGDLLPNATQDQLVATGYNRCNVTTGEGGSIDAEFIFRYAVDRASTMAETWLGLTAGCAVCHDHKYDPLTTRDFYSLYAFFQSNADPAMDGNALLTAPTIKVKLPEYDAKLAEFDRRLTVLQNQLDEKTAGIAYQDPAERNPRPAVAESDALWFDDDWPAGAKVGYSGHATAYSTTPEHVQSGKRSLKRGGAALAQDYYDSGAAPLDVPAQPRVFVHVFLSPDDPPEEIMIQFHVGAWKHRALWGEDVIEFGAKGTTERYLAGPLPPVGKWARLEVDAAKMGLSAGMKVTGFAFTVQGGTAYFDAMGVRGRQDPAEDPAQSFTAWRKAAAGRDTPGAPPDVNQWLKEGPDKPRQPAEIQKLRAHYLQTACAAARPAFGAMLTEMDALKKEREAYDAAVPSTFIFRDLDKPRDAFVMQRGQYDKPGEKVEPNTPSFLPPLRKATPRASRLDLAGWVMAPDNPLTARVTVNRFWQQIFGTGLVKTSHDFGTQGEMPSHPELLDALAVWFRENKWDVKKLLRLLVTSRAFRQQSAAPQPLWQADPENRLLARGPRFRLDAEQLRDQALFVGGLLDPAMGGKAVRIYQPTNIWEPVGFAGSNTRVYTQDRGAALYRRSIYAFLKRTAPPPFMANFDGPNREQFCTRRERSNTPLQALQLMNDIQHFEAARHLAQRLLTETGPAPEEKISLAWRLVLARQPSPEESASVRELFSKQLAKYRENPSAAEKAVKYGESPVKPGLDPAELAAWTLVANLALNLDEAIVRN